MFVRTRSLSNAMSFIERALMPYIYIYIYLAPKHIEVTIYTICDRFLDICIKIYMSHDPNFLG